MGFGPAVASFLGLTDTPSSYSGQTGLFTRVNAGEDALDFAAAGGAADFLALTDTPSSYVGQRFQIARVDAAEGALEFVNERGWPQMDDVGGTSWQMPGWGMAGTAGETLDADQLYYIPIYVERRRTFTQIGIHVNQSSPASVVRLGIYAATFDGDGDLTPGALTLDAGTVSTATTGQKSIAISQQLDPGFHFMAMSGDGTPNLLGPDFNVAVSTPVTGYQTTITGAYNPNLRVAVVDGAAALPNPAPAPTLALAERHAFVRIGKV